MTEKVNESDKHIGSDAKNFTLTFTTVSQYQIMVQCTAAPFWKP